MSLPQVVLDELKRWMGDVSQMFGVHGETGIDITMHGNIDEPVYAVSSGTVIGSGYYGGGGVESVQSNINYDGINGPASIYYQHLDINLLKKGDIVQQGELIGYTGGQLSGGSHPSSPQFSNGPHIEIGINAPYGQANKSIWSPLGKNINPLGFFQALASGDTSVLQNGTGGGPAITGTTGVTPTTTDSFNPLDIAGAIKDLPQNIIKTIGGSISTQTGVSNISDFGWRAGLVIIGLILISVAFIFINFDLLDKSNIQVMGTRV